MAGLSSIELAVPALAGVIAGLALLVRGFLAHTRSTRLADTATSRIATLAVGEVRVSGVVEAAELTLVSPLQSRPCVWYRAEVTESGDGLDAQPFREERAVGFRVRDETGGLRVFPRGARFDVPDSFEASSDDPAGAIGLELRTGSAFGPAALSPEAQIAALLTVREPSRDPQGPDAPSFGGLASLSGRSQRRRYREARLEPGHIVTLIGAVLPFDQLPDPAAADLGDAGPPHDDPDTTDALALARATGTLAATPEEAWGNAGIPGFGIGRPVRAPELDEDASPPELADAEQAAAAERTFDIGEHELVAAAGDDAPLLIAAGTPAAAIARSDNRFLVGLLGAVLAIVSAVALAMIAGGAAR